MSEMHTLALVSSVQLWTSCSILKSSVLLILAPRECPRYEKLLRKVGDKEKLAAIGAKIPSSEFTAAHAKKFKEEQVTNTIPIGDTADSSGFGPLACLELTAIKAMSTRADTKDMAAKLRCRVLKAALPWMSIRFQSLLKGSAALARFLSAAHALQNRYIRRLQCITFLYTATFYI